MLRQVLTDIFHLPTNVDRVFESCHAYFERGQDMPLYALGNTPYLAPLRRSLQRNGFKVSLRMNNNELPNISKSVAIIGMAGRFPGTCSDR